MKYGGQGGWRGIKRLNRDARVAEGLAPYGYRTRYSGRGSGQSRPIPRSEDWESVLRDAIPAIASCRTFGSNVLTEAELASLAARIDQFENKVRYIESTRPGFFGTLFFGQESWRADNCAEFQSLFESMESEFHRLKRIADERSDCFNAMMERLNTFVNEFDKRYTIPIDEKRLSAEDLQVLGRYSAAVEQINRTNGQDELGEPLHLTVLTNQSYELFQLLADHVVHILRLYQRQFSLDEPSVEIDRNGRTIVVDDFGFTFSVDAVKSSKPSQRRKKRVTKR